MKRITWYSLYASIPWSLLSLQARNSLGIDVDVMIEEIILEDWVVLDDITNRIGATRL